MTDQIITCQGCGRKTTIEKRETTERLARRRWFVIEDRRGIYGLVCGGNDLGVVKAQPGLTKDLFPDGKGGLIQRQVPPHEVSVELDLCIMTWANQWNVDTRLIEAHLFIPDLGNYPSKLAMVPLNYRWPM